MPFTTDSSGIQMFGLVKPAGASTKIWSHDWTNPTTWYSQAIRVVGEIATDAGAHTVYNLSQGNIIDTYHGLLTQEDYLKDAAGNSYRVTLKVNGTARNEQDPHVGSGGEYIVNYALGKVTFLVALQAGDEVKVTYHYANGSQFVVRPAAGKVLLVDEVETQFSADIAMSDTILSQPYALVSGTMIPIGNPMTFKTVRDLMNDSTRSWPSYPAMGGSGWRGLQQPTLVIDWDYLRGTLLSSAAGAELRLRLEHDTPLGGSFATSTFYCTTEAET